MFRVRDIKPYTHPNQFSAKTRFGTEGVPILRDLVLAKMKTCVALCFIAAAIATIIIVGDAQSVVPPTKAIIAPVTRIPVTKNPHNCDCGKECKDLHHSRVPFKQADYHSYLSYESFPILCRDASSTFFGYKKYLCKQTFDCCRKCNWLFYRCLKVLNKPYGFCIRSAYKCMCDCIDNHSFYELPYSKGRK